MNWSAEVTAEVPAGVVTVMLTLPLPGGLAAVICVPESVPIVPAAPPKLTPVGAGQAGAADSDGGAAPGNPASPGKR